jgi:Flp pilus assembly protein TadD
MDRFSLGQYSSAEQAFARAIQTGPTRTRYHFWLGFTLERQGRLEEARTQYQMELAQHPDTDTLAKARLDSLKSE